MSIGLSKPNILIVNGISFYSKLKLLHENWKKNLSNSDIDLNYINWVAMPGCPFTSATQIQNLVSIGLNALKLLSGIIIYIFCNRHLIRNQKLLLDISYPKTKSCINWPKKSENLYSIFSNSDLDLDHRHLGSNLKLRLEVSYPYSKFGVNRPKQIKVTERKLNFYF